jgi:hypothetical protein
MKEILRKCYVCDKPKTKTIKLETDKFIFYNNSYFHYDCFIKLQMKKKKNGVELTYDQAKDLADKMVIKTSQSEVINSLIDRDRLTYWIYENYNLTVLPVLFFQKIKQINDGTFSTRVNTPISYYDLLQMFKKMKTYLDKVNNNNERKGKKIDSVGRINYDLAIVINNYDDYLKWKQKQKAEEIENTETKNDIISKNNININTITSLQRKNNQKESEEINIADILDEVF